MEKACNIVKSELDSKLLRGPFITDVINFLRFLTPPLPHLSSFLLNKLTK